MSASRSVRARPAAAAADVRPPRPASLLGAAAAVPLGAAVLLAAALLPTGGRVVLGTALVVLGIALWTQETGFTGLRIGAPLLAALKPLLIGGGGLLAAAGAMSWADPGGLGNGAPPSGVAAAIPLATLLALLVGLAGVGAPRQVGGWRATATPPSPAWSAAVGAVGGLLAAVVVAWIAGESAGGERDGPQIALLVVALATGAIALAERRVGRAPADAAAVASLVMLALILGEATGAVRLAFGVLPSPDVAHASSSVVLAVSIVAGGALAAVLLVRAVVRRDLASGLLAWSLLAMARGDEATALRIAALTLPALGLVAAALLWRAPPGLVRAASARGLIWPGPEHRGAWALAVATASFAVATIGAGQLSSDGPRTVAATAVLLVPTLLIGVRLTGAPGRVAAIAVLTAFAFGWNWPALLNHETMVVIDDAGRTTGGDGSSTLERILVAVVPMALATPLVAGLWRRFRSPAVDALVVAVAVAGLIAGLGVLITGESMFGGVLGAADHLVQMAAVQLGVPAALGLGLAAVALVGRRTTVAGAQGASAAALVLAAVPAYQLSGLALAGHDFGLPDMRIVVGVAAALLLLAAALLAASTARRASGAAAFAALLSAIVVAQVVGTVGAGRGAGPPPSTPDLLDLVYGAEPLGSPLQHARPGWPLLLAMLGLTLLVAAALLERSRPAPAGAPIRRR